METAYKEPKDRKANLYAYNEQRYYDLHIAQRRAQFQEYFIVSNVKTILCKLSLPNTWEKPRTQTKCLFPFIQFHYSKWNFQFQENPQKIYDFLRRDVVPESEKWSIAKLIFFPNRKCLLRKTSILSAKKLLLLNQLMEIFFSSDQNFISVECLMIRIARKRVDRLASRFEERDNSDSLWFDQTNVNNNNDCWRENPFLIIMLATHTLFWYGKCSFWAPKTRW